MSIPPIRVVSEDSRWLGEVRRALLEKRPAVTVIPCAWDAVDYGDGMRPCLLLWHVASLDGNSLGVLEGAAQAAWNHASVVRADVSVPEMDRAVGALSDLGYTRIVPGPGLEHEVAVDVVFELFESRVYLLPPFLNALRCKSADDWADACGLLLQDPNLARTVGAWASNLGGHERHWLATRCGDLGLLLTPWELLVWTRLLSIVGWCCCQSPTPSQGEISRRFKFGTRKNLKRHAERVTGRGIGELLDAGPDGVLELVAELVDRRGPSSREDLSSLDSHRTTFSTRFQFNPPTRRSAP